MRRISFVVRIWKAQKGCNGSLFRVLRESGPKDAQRIDVLSGKIEHMKEVRDSFQEIDDQN